MATDCKALAWRKSSFSGDNGNCVQLAPLDGGSVAVRDSKNPEGGTLVFTRAEINAWVKGAQAGEFDDLTQ